MTPAPARAGLIELVRVQLPLRRAHRDVHRVEVVRDAVLVRVEVDGVEGWGECGALSRPGYWHEWTDGAWIVLRDLLAPAALHGEELHAAGHPMAMAALSTALLDAELRATARSLAEHLGATATRVPAGTVVAPPGPGTAAEVAELVELGYQRVKVKIGPADVGRLAELRRQLPDAPISVDANGSFDPIEPNHERALERLDDVGLISIEQPHPPDDLAAHARTSARLSTPVALDEPVSSPAVVRTVAALGGTGQVCLKPPRLGGPEGAVATARAAVDAGLVPWVGSLLETGVGRSVNLAVAAATSDIPGDLAPSSRHFADDITPPIGMEQGGWIPVPREPGASPTPLAGRLDEVVVSRCLLRP